MLIKRISIENFRSLKSCIVNFGEYTAFVGPNGSGKSTVLAAINIFFRNQAGFGRSIDHLYQDDFYNKDVSLPISISVTFSDLIEEAQKDFQAYFRNNELTVTVKAVFDGVSNNAPVKFYGERLAIVDFALYFEKEKTKAKVDELSQVFASLKTAYPDLPSAKTKQQMTDALHEYEDSHKEKCSLIPSEDNFYGVSRGQDRLDKYIQWVFIPALKDAGTEQTEDKNSAFGRLLARTIRAGTDFAELEAIRSEMKDRYRDVIEAKKPVLKSLSDTLEAELRLWSHPFTNASIVWEYDPDKNLRIDPPRAEARVGELQFQGEVSRFGHGLQRSYLFALLMVLSQQNQDNQPTLILGCEEPELFQHPPQLRHLAGVLKDLSNGNAQVVICTHSPLFVDGRSFNNVRLTRKLDTNGQVEILEATSERIGRLHAAYTGGIAPRVLTGVEAKIHTALQSRRSELFFSQRLILVEGVEDEAYLTAYLHLLNYWDDFRKYGASVVPVDGKSSILLPLIIAKEMRIPVYVLFDADLNEKKEERLINHRKDNQALFRACGIDDPAGVSFTNNVFAIKGLTVWETQIADVIEQDVGPEWTAAKNKVEAEYGHVGNLGKNTMFIGDLIIELHKRSRMSTSLTSLCNRMLEFVRTGEGL